MGDLSKNLSGYEMQCSFGCCASWAALSLSKNCNMFGTLASRWLSQVEFVAKHLTKVLTAVWFLVTFLIQIG